MFPIDSIIKANVNGFFVQLKIVKYLANNMVKVTPINQNKPFKIKDSAIISQVV